MKLTSIISAALVASALLIALPGCEKGPAEKAGEKIDNAGKSAEQQMDKVGDAVKDAVKKDEDKKE